MTQVSVWSVDSVCVCVGGGMLHVCVCASITVCGDTIMRLKLIVCNYVYPKLMCKLVVH